PRWCETEASGCRARRGPERARAPAPSVRAHPRPGPPPRRAAVRARWRCPAARADHRPRSPPGWFPLLAVGLGSSALPRTRPSLCPGSLEPVTSGLAVRGPMQRLAVALLDDVERIAGLSVARMRELLPSYAKVPADALIPVTLTNTRNLLK